MAPSSASLGIHEKRQVRRRGLMGFVAGIYPSKSQKKYAVKGGSEAILCCMLPYLSFFVGVQHLSAGVDVFLRGAFRSFSLKSVHRCLIDYFID